MLNYTTLKRIAITGAFALFPFLSSVHAQQAALPLEIFFGDVSLQIYLQPGTSWPRQIVRYVIGDRQTCTPYSAGTVNTQTSTINAFYCYSQQASQRTLHETWNVYEGAHNRFDLLGELTDCTFGNSTITSAHFSFDAPSGRTTIPGTTTGTTQMSCNTPWSN